MQNELQAVKNFVQELSNTRQFEIGDVVVWKEGFKNKQWPALNQKAIVSYVYPHLVFTSEEDVDALCCLEPLNIRLAFIHPYGSIVDYPYDSRRFRLAD